MLPLFLVKGAARGLGCSFKPGMIHCHGVISMANRVACDRSKTSEGWWIKVHFWQHKQPA